MKRSTILMLCLLLAVAAMAIPEMANQFCQVNASDGLILAAGIPAFGPLNWETGQNNMGGYKNFLLFVPVNSVTKVPEVPKPEDVATPEDMVMAVGAFEFITNAKNKKPIYLYSVDGTVEHKADAQGETDGISYKRTLSCFFPGNTPEMHAFNAMIKNTPGYFVYEDSDGRQCMLGMKGMPASVSPSFNGGKARADRRGTTFTATADCNYSEVFLKTPIDIDALLAEINGVPVTPP